MEALGGPERLEQSPGQFGEARLAAARALQSCEMGG